jgi:hypothetical protein
MSPILCVTPQGPPFSVLRCFSSYVAALQWPALIVCTSMPSRELLVQGLVLSYLLMIGRNRQGASKLAEANQAALAAKNTRKPVQERVRSRQCEGAPCCQWEHWLGHAGWKSSTSWVTVILSCADHSYRHFWVSVRVILLP